MHKLTLKDKKRFDRAYGSLKTPLGDNNFASFYLLDGFYRDVEWSEINGNLCLFLTSEGRRSVWGPVLPGKKLADTLRKCFSMCENFSVNNMLAKRPCVKYIPEELKEKYSSLKGFSLRKHSSDYVYRASDLIELKGRKYGDKRNKRNYFLRNYEFRADAYSSKHAAGCRDLLRRWKEKRAAGLSGKLLEKLEAEAEANEKALRLAGKLAIEGMVVLIGGKVEGFIFGQKVNKDLCILLHGKTNLEVKGLSQFITGEFLSRTFSECRLVNDMEDWGVGYLASSKKSYAPFMANNGYMLVENGRL